MQRLADQNLITALVLAFVGVGAVYSAGDDVKNWMFPLLAAYVLLAIAAMLCLRVIYETITQHAPDIFRVRAEERIALTDVLVFALVVLVYVILMHGLGFWIASFLMLSVTSTYLTLNKTRRNVVLAVVVPLTACIAAYLIFLRVFYVPFPKATWFGG